MRESRARRRHLRDTIPADDELSFLVATEPLKYLSQPKLSTGFAPYAIALVNIDALKAKDLLVANFMATKNRDLTLLRNLGNNIFEPIHFEVNDEEAIGWNEAGVEIARMPFDEPIYIRDEIDVRFDVQRMNEP